jgi:ribosomal protein S18 acetylase RimI-like enzyme
VDLPDGVEPLEPPTPVGARGPTASLSTIEENPTGSVALYEKLGYRITVRQPPYRKAL